MVLAFACLYLFLSLDSNKALYVKLGKILVKQHQAPYEREYAMALKSLELENAESVIHTLTKWQDVRKGDRAFPLKRTLFLKLSDLLHKQKNSAQLLVWTRAWQILDGRDITARAYYLEALRMTPEFHAEGVEGLFNAYQQFPENPRLARFYADSLRAAGDTVIASKIQSKKIVGQMYDWELFWDTEEGFNPVERSKVDVLTVNEGVSHFIDFTLPPGTLRFRLDLPPHSELEVSDISIKINQEAFPVDASKLSLVMMQFSEGVLSSNGRPDPHIIFDIGESDATSKSKLELHIKFTLSRVDGSSG